MNKIFCYREIELSSHWNNNIKQNKKPHPHILKEFGKESVIKLQRWEKIEKKMADFQNHRRFSLRCLKYDVIPVRVRL